MIATLIVLYLSGATAFWLMLRPDDEDDEDTTLPLWFRVGVPALWPLAGAVLLVGILVEAIEDLR